MRCFGVILSAIAGLAIPAAGAGKDFTGRITHGGMIGLGQAQYSPVTCAYACRNAASGWMIDCGDSDMSGMDGMPDMHMSMPTPQCFAANDPYLQTLAWCIKTRCPTSLTMSQLEAFWQLNIAGRLLHPPTPKYSYQVALSHVTTPPTTVVNSSEILNRTSLVGDWIYEAQYGSLAGIEMNVSLSNQYTLVVLLTCSLLPVVLSLLRFLPLPPSAVNKFYAYFIDPPVLGSHHAVPVLFGMGIMPTRGQALFIFYIWAINIILCAVNYKVTWPNIWFTNLTQEMTDYIAVRTGMVSFGNLILALLFASRNNFLLWLTSWSRSTFVIIHRWIAFICILQVCIHSALFLQLQLWQGSDALASESAYPYWYWGVIGTWALVLILPLSILPVREKAYEFFLAWHNLFALLTLIATFFHIYFRYYWQWGYEIWVCVMFSVWAFDRVLARPVRIVANGLRLRAFVSVVDDDYLKVDIPGIEAKGYAFLYFPTLTWRIWENHPFSIMPMSGSLSSCRSSKSNSPVREDLESGNGKQDDTNPKVTVQPGVEQGPPPPSAISSGVVFFIRRRGGLTAQLTSHAGVQGIPVLVESSYGSETMSFVHAPSTRPSLTSPNVICIAGGVGITAVLPLLDRPLLARSGKTKLFWGVRTEPLVRAVEGMLNAQDLVKEDGGRLRWGDTEVVVSIGVRFNVKELLARELQDRGLKGGTTVVACGPPGMSDDIRIAVSELAKGGAAVRLSEERFGW